MNKRQVVIGGRTWAMWLNSRGKDALGYEPDEMLKDRIERSLGDCPDTYKGARLPYEPRSGPVYLNADGRLIYEFECGLQELCERLGVELCVDDSDGASQGSGYLVKNSSAPRAQIFIDECVRDATVYEVNDDAPDGAREGFEE